MFNAFIVLCTPENVDRVLVAFVNTNMFLTIFKILPENIGIKETFKNTKILISSFGQR